MHSKRTSHIKKAIQDLPRCILILILLVWTVLPMAWIVMTSFKSSRDITTYPPLFFFKPTWNNYIQAISRYNFSSLFKNSLIVSLSSMALSVGFGLFAAYTLTRFKFKGSNALSMAILGTRMMPGLVLLLPLYTLMRGAGLLNTHLGLILAHTSFNLPFAIWMLRGFFQELPKELEEAAKIDGCSLWQAVFRVVFPLALPGIAATAVLTFIFSWNEFLFALAISGTRARTLPVGISGYFGESTISWGLIAASGTVVMLPALIFSFVAQKYIVHGLTMGAIKG